MSLTQEQIQKLSENLSKIRIDKAKLTDNINEILTYFELLSEVNTDGILGTNSVVTENKALREDRETQKHIHTNDLLICSPQKVIQNQIAISNIM